MKLIITNFAEYINENIKIPNKLSHSLAGKAWNDLWKKNNFHYKNIYIENKYNDEKDINIFRILIHRKDVQYPRFFEIGINGFHGIDEERNDFFKWLNKLGLLEKKSD